MFDFEKRKENIKTISVADFEKTWSTKLSAFVVQAIREKDFRYRELTASEYARCAQEIEKTLTSDLTKSGEHRHSAWVRGWGENAEALKQSANVESIIPRYFEKIPVVRWQGRWILPLSQSFEFNMFEVLQLWIFDRYLKDSNYLYEFGCGTGHNLLRARRVNSKMKLIGLDWAESSQEILRTLKERGVESNIEGRRFDFFNPDSGLKIEGGSDIMTLAALEQTSDRYEGFLNFLISQAPRRVIHLEPIEELLDDKTELDRFSIQYFHKRNYLKNYLTTLRSYERAGRIKIERAERTGIGSFFIEGYSLIVWMPLR